MENRNENLQIDYKKLSDEGLIDLLFSEGDRLSREAADEIISRGEKMIDFLEPIVKSRYNWECDDIEQWAPIHATFILGSIGGKESVDPLISSLRFSDNYDCDWVYEKLPAMFGKIGMDAIEPLKKVVLDKSNDWFVRSIALDGMAAVIVNYPEIEKEIFDFIASIMKDCSEEMDIRGMAGNILIDFKQKRYQKSLREFVAEEKELADEDSDYTPTFGEESVDNMDLAEEKDLRHYAGDWLEFYVAEEIEKRQKRWKDENSRLYKIKSWWNSWKFEREMKVMEKEEKNILPQIKLKYFGRHGEKPMFGDAECYICHRKNIFIGGMGENDESGDLKFICEDCAVFKRKNEFGIKSFAAAKAHRRRMFDVAYLFKEMVIEKYLNVRGKKSVDDLTDGESEKLFRLADENYNELFSKEKKEILEATKDQKIIEEKMKEVVDKIEII